MEPPSNTDWPFFAYGLFRPGQLAFFQLRELVGDVSEPAEVSGHLHLRDGLPLIELGGEGRIKGALLTFMSERAAEAYVQHHPPGQGGNGGLLDAQGFPG